MNHPLKVGDKMRHRVLHQTVKAEQMADFCSRSDDRAAWVVGREIAAWEAFGISLEQRGADIN